MVTVLVNIIQVSADENNVDQKSDIVQNIIFKPLDFHFVNLL